jgi:hypothetical protein
LGKKDLVDLSRRYHQIGRRWTTVAKLIRETPKDPEKVNEARSILLDFASEETKALSSLVKIFG